MQKSEDEGEQLRTSQNGERDEEVKEVLSNQDGSRRKKGNHATQRKDKSISSQSRVRLEQEEQTGKSHKSHTKQLDAHLRIHTEEEPSQSSESVKSDCLSKPNVNGPVLRTGEKSCVFGVWNELNTEFSTFNTP